MTEYIEYGRRPGAVYVPRFRNSDSKDDGVGFKRGYGLQGGAGRSAAWPEGFGAAMKHGMRKYGPWYFSMGAFGECLPYEDNHVSLHPTKVDRFGIPQLEIGRASCRERSVSVRVDLGGRRILQKKITYNKKE